ncbi:MAG: shikimate dehydrogenase [Deltaproteobacteria bacterium]|nr:shikimate dehydrogenase [Deltaproteobacteria bacterium]
MIDAKTQLYGLIGNPVRHSLSPIIHNSAFREMGLNAIYLAFEVKNLRAALEGIKGSGIRGVSVTIPFKREAIPFLDEIEAVAERIRAINTIANQSGKLVGYNTDWSGALMALEGRIDLKDRRVLLIGAGGAARAIGFGLKEKGAEIFISNRSPERGKQLAQELRGDFRPSIHGLGVDVIINATSIGMHPQPEATPFSEELLKEGMLVMDIVYQPLETRLLRAANKRGCLTINGLEMLLYQAILQIEIWTGRRPDALSIREYLRRAVSPVGEKND